MQPIVSIVGKSGGGKTTLLESLIVELKRRGRKIAIIKHTHHDFDIDEVGKDSWRFSEAGGDVVTVSSPGRFAIFKKTERDLNPQEIARYIVGDYDLILTEGFMRSDALKIEVHRKEVSVELLCSPHQLLAVVTDEPLTIDVPQFSTDEVGKIIDLLEDKVMAQQEREDVELFINDTYIPIKLFVREFLARTLIGMVSALRGVKEVKSLSISLRRKD